LIVARVLCCRARRMEGKENSERRRYKKKVTSKAIRAHPIGEAGTSVVDHDRWGRKKGRKGNTPLRQNEGRYGNKKMLDGVPNKKNQNKHPTKKKKKKKEKKTKKKNTKKNPKPIQSSTGLRKESNGKN